MKGGIHRYLEAYPDGGCFQGKNFVFDSRVSMAPPLAKKEDASIAGNEINRYDLSKEIIGLCIDCAAVHDTYSGESIYIRTTLTLTQTLYVLAIVYAHTY